MISKFRELVLLVVNTLLHHPHYPSIGVYSRMITNLSCIFWAVDIISHWGHLRGSPVPWMVDLSSDQLMLIAGIMLFAGLFQLLWLLKGWPPLRWCSWSYFIVWAWWCFITWLTILGVDSAAPNLKAGLVALFIVSTFAWLSTPRHNDSADHAAPN